MIVDNPSRALPEEWTDELCRELLHHAHELGRNGNPGGYMLTAGLFPFVGTEDEQGRSLKPHDDWDYDGIRAWIADHPEPVRIAWQRAARPDWW